MTDQQDISRHSENAAHQAAAKEKAERPLDAAACFGSATVRDLERHNAAWVKHFVKPVARFMRERGISEVRIKIGRDGKASYLLEPDAEWLGNSIQNNQPSGH
jgi:hypothetical protein